MFRFRVKKLIKTYFYDGRLQPKFPHKYEDFEGFIRNGCPRCYRKLGRNEILYAGQKYCSVCGQAIRYE